MKVYIVWEAWEYEGQDLKAVYATREQAVAEVERLMAKIPDEEN